MLVWAEWPYKGCVGCNFGDIFQENVHLVPDQFRGCKRGLFLWLQSERVQQKDFFLVYFNSQNVHSNPVEQQMHLKFTLEVAILKSV